MTTIQRIKPIRVIPVTTPQCCVNVKDFTSQKRSPEYLKRREVKCKAKGIDPEKCQQQSSYVINGKHYCTKHAGMKSLQILTGECEP